MVDALLLVLREVLEASLIICLLLSLSRKLLFPRAWIITALIGGFSGAWLLADYAYSIAESWDGMGQEFLNAALYGLTILSALCLILMIVPRLFVTPMRTIPFLKLNHFFVYSLCIVIVSFSIAREGSEIWIYISGFSAQPDMLYPALVGSVIGVGIGVSLGAITYYVLVFMPEKYFLAVFIMVMMLVAGGFAMQIAEQLMQVGLLESTAPLWDSSFLVSEQSWTGELLYALIGYDAKPTITQGIFYLAAIAPVLIAVVWHLFRSKVNTHE